MTSFVINVFAAIYFKIDTICITRVYSIQIGQSIQSKESDQLLYLK
jgi:hypothetical protein